MPIEDAFSSRLRKPIELMEKNIFSRYNANISRNNVNISRYYANVSRNNANVSRYNANVSRNNANITRNNANKSHYNANVSWVCTLPPGRGALHGKMWTWQYDKICTGTFVLPGPFPAIFPCSAGGAR